MSFKSLWSAVLVAMFLVTASVAQAGTLHLVVVADNNDGDAVFNQLMNRDIVNILVLANNAAKESGLRFSGTALFENPITDNAFRSVTRGGKTVKTGGHWAIRNLKAPFDGLNYTRKTTIDRDSIRGVLNGLQVGADDVVWVHYTGHGFRWDDKKNKWPALDIGEYLEDAMEFDEILTFLNGTSARLKMAFADSCNEQIGYDMPESQKHSGARGASKRKAGFKKLFKDGKGYLYMGATSPGELGYAVEPQGGVFSYKVVHRIMIEVERGSAASWDDMAAKFKKPIYDFDVKQTPIYEYSFGSVQSSAPASKMSKTKITGKKVGVAPSRVDRSRLKGFKAKSAAKKSQAKRKSKQRRKSMRLSKAKRKDAADYKGQRCRKACKRKHRQDTAARRKCQRKCGK